MWTTFIKLIHLNVIFRSVSSCDHLGITGKRITDHRDQRPAAHTRLSKPLLSHLSSVRPLRVIPSGNTQPKVCSHALTRPSHTHTHTHTVPTLLTAAALLHRFTQFSTRSAGVLLLGAEIRGDNKPASHGNSQTATTCVWENLESVNALWVSA